MKPNENLTSGTSGTAKADDLELAITRIFDAPRSLVFKAWTEPEHLARWWGPSGFTLPSCKVELRPGGAYRFHMRSSEGTDHYSQGVFREVLEPERLVMAGSWADADGNRTQPATVVTVTFEDLGRKTKMTLRQSGFESVTSRDEHNNGWSQSFDRLAEYLERV